MRFSWIPFNTTNNAKNMFKESLIRFVRNRDCVQNISLKLPRPTFAPYPRPVGKQKLNVIAACKGFYLCPLGNAESEYSERKIQVHDLIRGSLIYTF